VLTTVIVQLLAVPLLDMMPVVTEALSRDAADRLGILTACVAFGSVGQILVISRLHDRQDAPVVVGVMFAASGAFLIGIALDPNLFLVGLLLIAFGLAVSVGKTLLLTSVHLGGPDSHRHHVLSLYVFVTALALPLSTLVWGMTAELFGIEVTIAVAGTLLIASVAVGMVSTGRRHAPVSAVWRHTPALRSAVAAVE
jgi:predicted MFS family arabinose efflux permease